MRILMIARSTLFSSPGGDTTQIEMTAKYLRELGVTVDIKLSNDSLAYDSYDILHFFNIIRPDDILPHVQDTRVPFVISTIFVDYYEYEKNNRSGLLKVMNSLFDRDQIEYIKTLARSVKNGEKIKSSYYIRHGQRQSIHYLAKQAAMLLPNSHSEYQRFVNIYGISQRYQKVVNAIDPALFNNSIQPDPTYKDHVLCVGRIEGRKNQLNLIKALQGTDLKLTIIGKPSPNHLAYYQQCKELAAAAGNVQFIDHINHHNLATLYKAARVHVLPSWFETTGLSSLEAGVLDCNLVITRKGDTEEYFGDMAYYCEPDSVESIREAVLRAWREPIHPQLKEYILTNYTWQHAARQTLEAYRAVLH
ncbi:glycosyltransferase family 4 protein [Telluribacter sp. SYSU D00476]|uniref:glycosyltransferase family 4 protein n=1 Tax=Telluribacter sp. SYSU D00476 TaxID=2811430 RepID=UPI001FF443B0|nr:glycosyltransferase family 4 protein [Telluribacter sp. SYSU D00476]